MSIYTKHINIRSSLFDISIMNIECRIMNLEQYFKLNKFDNLQNIDNPYSVVTT